MPKTFKLEYSRHLGWKDATANTWKAERFPLGGGFPDYKFVFTSDEGAIYGVTQTGDLEFSKHAGWLDGSNELSHKRVIIQEGGYKDYLLIFGGNRGTFYAVTPDGKLQWFQHTGWNGDEAQLRTIRPGAAPLGIGFDQFGVMFCGDLGTIYGIRRDSELIDGQWISGRLYRFVRAKWDADTPGFSNGKDGTVVGEGWGADNYRSWTAGPAGTVYVVNQSGDIEEYIDRDYRGNTRNWADPHGSRIANHWFGKDEHGNEVLKGFIGSTSMASGQQHSMFYSFVDEKLPDLNP